MGIEKKNLCVISFKIYTLRGGSSPSSKGGDGVIYLLYKIGKKINKNVSKKMYVKRAEEILWEGLTLHPPEANPDGIAYFLYSHCYAE